MNLQTILIKYRSLPENYRLVLTACIGALIGFITYELIYFLNPLQPKASTSWTIAFLIGVARQHALHRWLTFLHDTPYWKSLGRAYVMYSSSLIVTSVVNWILTEQLLIPHRLAWLICLLVNAMISLVFLKRYVFKFQEQEKG
jgi:putative flippase GtrA